MYCPLRQFSVSSQPSNPAMIAAKSSSDPHAASQASRIPDGDNPLGYRLRNSSSLLLNHPRAFNSATGGFWGDTEGRDTTVSRSS